MTEEVAADSGESSIDMGAAMDDITSSIFPDAQPVESQEEVIESTEEVIESTDEVEDALQQEEEVEATTEEEITEKLGLPASWKKDMQEKWDSIDPDTQAYFLKREQQMQDGLEKDRGDANLGRVMRDVMAPYSQMLKAQNIDESVMVRNLMNAHYRLSTSDDAGKLALMQQFARSYGINLDGSQPQQVDPTIQVLQNRLQGLESHITASHQRSLQEARTRVESDVHAFASDPDHEFFDEVAEQIVPLINAGYELEDAYNNAIWLNPVTRQKQIEKTAAEAAAKAEETAKQQAEKARKAKSANVRGRDTSKTPTEPTGTMEDTMREIYRELNRS